MAGLNERYVATEGQTVFHSTKDYSIGAGSLMVFVNGILAFMGLDQNYVETNSKTVTFNYPMDVDDIVVLSEQTTTNPNLKIISFDPTQSMLSKYGSEIRLKNNNKYKIDIFIEGRDYSWSFSSKYSPMYTNVKDIRADIMGLIETLPNETINFIVYQNSKLCKELWDIALTNNTSSSVTTTIPTKVKMWTRYKTDLDLLNAVYLSLSGQSGKTSKILGPMTIEKDTKLPYLKDMIARFSKLFDSYDMQLRGTFNNVQAFIKAGTTMTYPYAGRGTAF